MAQERPKASNEGPRSPQERPKSSHERPKASHDRPKSALRAPQDTPRAPQESPKSAPSAPKSGQERPKSGQRCLQKCPGEPSATILGVGNAENTLVESDRSLESLEKRIPDDCQMIFRQCAQMWDCEKHGENNMFCEVFASRLFCARVISRNKRISEKHENRSIRGSKIEPSLEKIEPSFAKIEPRSTKIVSRWTKISRRRL